MRKRRSSPGSKPPTSRHFGFSSGPGNASLAPMAGPMISKPGGSRRPSPIPEWLAALKDRAARFAGLGSENLVQALVIRYDPGAGIGWHKDRPVFEDVIGISLGSPAVLRLRRRAVKGFERCSVPIASRSIYHLTGEARDSWEHSIAPIDACRWSITFRSLRVRPGSRNKPELDF